MDSDEEDFVFYGTSIEREEDVSSRKKKAVAQASGQLRTLAPWKQEVIDEEGRRRFHGAFTGGFSAGYYNTVGSKEGWTPQAFTSSRKNRAEVKQQSIYNFLDDDEKADLEGRSLSTSMQFDTFGFTAAELARKQADKEQNQRPSVIPGSVPDELVVPATDSIGVKLLLKMGWRHGRSIKDARANSFYDARREARKAFLALSFDDIETQLTHSEVVESETYKGPDIHADDIQYSKSTPVYVLSPKQDLYGLGFDPFKQAPEFRERKILLLSGARDQRHPKTLSTKDGPFGPKSSRVAPGFGIGALEDLDFEDEDVYTADYDFEETYIHDSEEPSRLSIENKKRSGGKKQGVLPGFRIASNAGYQLERFDPPVIPKDFVPHHKFPASLEVEMKLADDPPREVSPPEDNNLKVLIEGVATLVARCGKLFEDLSREKNHSSPLFSFLNGGNGHDYYRRKLWEERQKRTDQTKEKVDKKVSSGVEKMTAESRGKILGEKPLERSHKDLRSSVTPADTASLQLNLSDTFTKPVSFNEPPEVAKPFQDNPAKQKRFEQFLKEKYQGGLRSKDAGGASDMSEAARARERLEFESAADATEKGKWGKESKPSNQQHVDVLINSGLQFTSGGLEQDKESQAEELAMKKMYPKRTEFQWRPAPILCKRFDIIDPYMGKPPPGPRMKSKMDSLIFTPDSLKASKVEKLVAVERDPLSFSQLGIEEKDNKVTDGITEFEVEVENVERPVDLYKAIFSDDSDEEKNSGQEQVEDPQKRIDAANTTLNRFIAGDFLQSLGEELGLEVPPDQSLTENKARISATRMEISTNNGENNTSSVENNLPYVVNAASGNSINQPVPQCRLYHPEMNEHVGAHKHEFTDGDPQSSGKTMQIISSENRYGTNNSEKEAQDFREAKTLSSMCQSGNSSSSEDERNRKRSRLHRHKRSSSSNETADSSDYRDRYHSKSRRKGSSREKSSRRKHSKHHKHTSRDSRNKHSHHFSEKENVDASREKRKYRASREKRKYRD